jgi:micrococcal nuclease
MRRIALVAALGCAACSSADDVSTSNSTIAPREPNATVEFVIDGDTVDVMVDGTQERARLIGIDTPETKKPDTPVECFGLEATAHLQALLPVGTPVRLERDVVGRDDFGRLLVYVYRATDGLFVNMAMLADGYGQPLTIPPNVTFSDAFVDAAAEAERRNLGLWAACGQ